jgi:hypothetical protein
LTKTVSELLPDRPDVQLRIYAYSLNNRPGELKVGQTTRDVKKRVEEQTKTAGHVLGKDLHIVVNELGVRENGSVIRDSDVRNALVRKGFKNTALEWMACSVDDVLTVIQELLTGVERSGTHHETFSMRPEQQEAVDKTFHFFRTSWEDSKNAVPRFLWNAKMRFGKTFASYQLASRISRADGKPVKVLVVTFKPAVEDSWQTELLSHVDFDGWQYFSAKESSSPATADASRSMIYFGSFQDLLGRDKLGNVKSKNTWLHTTNWDLVIFDEYHFGAWRETAKELFECEDDSQVVKEIAAQYGKALEDFNEDILELGETEADFLPITTRAFLYLSGTPFRALSYGEFDELNIFNWTYTDEQRAKQRFGETHPEDWNPYGALPQMRLFAYQMPDELISIASQGEFDEFDLNAFFYATGAGANSSFRHKGDVQKWLDIIRGAYRPTQVENLKLGSARPPFPYSDVRLLPHLQHSFWFLPSVAACHAMASLLFEKQNSFWHDYSVLTVAGASAGVGLEALAPVRRAIGNGFDTRTITLSCGKLTTGVTIPQWSSIFMLRNLRAPETYFQAAFRVQSPWAIKNPNGDDPNEELIVKPVCFVFDFAPTRALRQISEYATGLSPNEANPERAVEELVNFLPVLAYDGSNMTQVDAGAILDIAMSGTSATLLARKWQSSLLVNVDNETLKRILSNEKALEAVMNIEGFRALGDDVIQTVINKSESVKDTKKRGDSALTEVDRKQLTVEEKEYKSKRKLIQEKLVKFATRIPAFMYLTDFRENTLQDVITRIEPDLFKTVTGLTVDDFGLLVSLGVFNAAQMNQAVFAFRRYEDASLSYTGLESHERLRRWGLYDTVVAIEN